MHEVVPHYFMSLPSSWHGIARQTLMQSLAKLAIMSGRVPVWPTVPCSAPFVSGKEQHAAPVEVPPGWLAYHSRSHDDDKVQCFFLPMMEPECLYDKAGTSSLLLVVGLGFKSSTDQVHRMDYCTVTSYPPMHCVPAAWTRRNDSLGIRSLQTPAEA